MISKILNGVLRNKILEEVIRRVRNGGLKLKKDKCQFLFGQTSMKFLGHVVSARGKEPDLDRVRAVQDFQTPSSRSKVRGFLIFPQ